MQYLGQAVSAFALGLFSLLSGATGVIAGPTSEGASNQLAYYHENTDQATTECGRIADRYQIKNNPSVRFRFLDATADMPEHCEIVVNIPPETGVYVALPTKWNGRIWMIGNGGFAGGAVGPLLADVDDHTVAYRRAVAASGVRRGFVTAYTNGGHYQGTPFDGSFAFQRPDLIEDLAYKSIHKGIKFAKKAVSAFYGRKADYSYFEGCAGGGRQGLMAATRYPGDFDGIVANAPVLRWSELMIKARWNHMALSVAPSLNLQKIAFAFQFVLGRCDSIDGVEDGLIADPRECDFDPVEHLPSCHEKPENSCFTEEEKRALVNIRQGPPLRGEYPLPQYWDTLSSETAIGWLANPDGSPNRLSTMAESFFKYVAFIPEQDPEYDWSTFDFIHDPARMRNFDEIMNPGSDFEAFRRRGGKILGFWGWSDASVNPASGINFHESLAGVYGGGRLRDFYRQFFIPGVGNCSGGYGPDEIDVMTVLINWVEKSHAPERLHARKTVAGKAIYNRTYCPFPQSIHYESGNPENPDNWRCGNE